MKGDMNRHMMTHTGEKPYSCKLCCKTLAKSHKISFQASLWREIRIVTWWLTPEKSPILVNYVSKLSQNLTKSHKISQNLVSGFSMKGDKNRHMMTHTGEKPHSCELCGKISQNLLKSHKIPFQVSLWREIRIVTWRRTRERSPILVNCAAKSRK